MQNRPNEKSSSSDILSRLSGDKKPTDAIRVEQGGRVYYLSAEPGQDFSNSDFSGATIRGRMDAPSVVEAEAIREREEKLVDLLIDDDAATPNPTIRDLEQHHDPDMALYQRMELQGGGVNLQPYRGALPPFLQPHPPSLLQQQLDMMKADPEKWAEHQKFTRQLVEKLIGKKIEGDQPEEELDDNTPRNGMGM